MRVQSGCDPEPCEEKGRRKEKGKKGIRCLKESGRKDQLSKMVRRTLYQGPEGYRMNWQPVSTSTC